MTYRVCPLAHRCMGNMAQEADLAFQGMSQNEQDRKLEPGVHATQNWSMLCTYSCNWRLIAPFFGFARSRWQRLIHECLALLVAGPAEEGQTAVGRVEPRLVSKTIMVSRGAARRAGLGR